MISNLSVSAMGLASWILRLACRVVIQRISLRR
jgi:hypothetical protein